MGRPPTHGHYLNRKGSPTWNSWKAMHDRCSLPTHLHYSDYGGRGITICPEWVSFEQFLTDMGARPEGTSLDRYPDKNGNYCKENCRWATALEQHQNKRNNRLYAYDGETQCVSEWARRSGVGRSTINERLRRGWSIDRALTTPVAPTKRADDAAE